MLNAIPIFGWFLSAFFSISLAIPFWWLWTVCGYGSAYFYWLPSIYLHPPFWDCVAIFMIVSILKMFIPTFSSSSSTSKD